MNEIVDGVIIRVNNHVISNMIKISSNSIKVDRKHLYVIVSDCALNFFVFTYSYSQEYLTL